MDFSNMTFDEIEARRLELASQIEAVDAKAPEARATLDALESELKAIEERKAELAKIAADEAETRQKIADGEIGDTIADNIIPKENRTMVDIKEFRNSTKYVDAYAEYIKTGDETELRALLTENVEDGTIAVPDMVLDVVKTAWDKDEIMSLVSKVSIKGNLKVNFEISGTDAVVHTEGSGAVDEETLTMGIVTLVPAFVKKWISVSDEVLAMRGESFLRYIYEELTQKIVKKIADQLIGIIAALPQSATATSVAAAKITAAPALGTIADAVANLSDEASKPTIVMNKLTWSAFKAAQYNGNYGVDIFEGLKVVFNNTLPAYGSASANAVYVIVGDFGQGAIANFPDGESVKFVFDDKTLATSDLVRVIGKEYVAVGAVANKAFTLIAKPASV